METKITDVIDLTHSEITYQSVGSTFKLSFYKQPHHKYQVLAQVRGEKR